MDMQVHEVQPQMDLQVSMDALHRQSETLPARGSDAIASAFREAGGGVVYNHLTRICDYIEIAEQEIENTITSNPAKAGQINAAFRCLTWLLPDMPNDAVYRSHARELLGRVLADENLSPGTWAEMLVTLSSASLAAPLTHQAVTAMGAAMVKVLGATSVKKALGTHAAALMKNLREDASAELLSGLRQKLAKERDARKRCTPRNKH
jgi:hypothetical protein